MFGSSNTFDPKTDIPDLNGKVFVVTGGTAGLGFGIVAHILEHNPEKIYILSQKEHHADEAMEALKEYGDVSKVQWKQCNLENLEETRKVAEELKNELFRLDALVLNAGLGVGVYNTTVDGIDSHFQVNQLSQHMLAMILLPLLKETPNSRIVAQSSDMHQAIPSDVAFASKAEINTDIGATYLYGRSKLAQILWVRALHKRITQGAPAGDYTPDRIFINATHPGANNTDQPKQAVDAYGIMGKIGAEMVKPFMKDPVQSGCRSALFAATSEDIITDSIRGQYIVPDRQVTAPSSRAQDEEMGERLWSLQEQLLKEKFGQLPYEEIWIMKTHEHRSTQ